MTRGTFYLSPFPFDRLFVIIGGICVGSIKRGQNIDNMCVASTTLSDRVVILSKARYLKPQPLIEMDDNRTVTLFLPAVERGFATRNRENKGSYAKIMDLHHF